MNIYDWIRIVAYTLITLSMLDCARYLTPKKGSSDTQRAFFAMCLCLSLMSLSLLVTILSARGQLALDLEFSRLLLTGPVALVAAVCLRIFYIFRIKK